MKKRKNYYSVHKNKKPKVNTKVGRFYFALNAILKLTEVLNKINLQLKTNTIPQYKKGGLESKVVGVVGNVSKPEMIIDKDGISKSINSYRNKN